MLIASPAQGNPNAAWFRPAINDLRLGLESGVYVSTADQIGKTALWLNSGRNGRQIGLHTGTSFGGWALKSLPSDAGIAISLGTLVTATNYDLYVYDNAGSVAFDTIVPWINSGVAITAATNATPIVITTATHGVSAGDEVYISGVQGNTAANGTWIAAAVSGTTITLTGSVGNAAYTAATGYLQARTAGTKPVLFEGVFTKTANRSRRYVGCFRTTSTTTTEDSGGRARTTNVGGKRFLWNVDNQVERSLSVLDTTASWSYVTDTIRQARATAGNKVEYLTGLADLHAVQTRITASVSMFSNATKGAKVGIGLDSTTVFVTGGKVQSAFNPNASAIISPIGAEFRGNPGPGYHAINWLEKGADTNCTFQGKDTGDSSQSGLDAVVWG